jgi:molybdopterin molybdotransferase
MEPLVPGGLPSVDEARARILDALTPLGTEQVAVERALGRVLAEQVVALEDTPAFSASQMDGYAVRAEEVAGASEAAPVLLPVALRVAAGEAPSMALPAAAAARIFTGAPLPEGADAVIPQEWTDGGADRVTVERGPDGPGAFVRARGADFRAGDALLAPGARLTPGAVALAVACGRGAVRVARRPRVALVATGSELLLPGAAWRPGAVRETNRLLLRGLLRAAGAEIVDLGIAPDDPRALRARLASALERADLVITTGGVSVGEADHVKREAEALGVQRLLWRVRVRPGKPLYFGVRQRESAAPVGLLGLPGNPGSVLATLTLFGLPAVRRLQGARQVEPLRAAAVLTGDAGAPAGRRAYLRARLDMGDDGRLRVEALSRQASGSIRSVGAADALIEIGEEGGRFGPGDLVPVVLLREP